MELNENIIWYIKEEAKRIHHGCIKIEINTTSKKIDVVTESRERFADTDKPAQTTPNKH